MGSHSHSDFRLGFYLVAPFILHFFMSSTSFAPPFHPLQRLRDEEEFDFIDFYKDLG